jgi:hypothetical protein
MWQKCPICNGTGVTHTTLSTSGFETCSNCYGTKIISKLDDLPPNYEQNKVMPNNLKNYPSTYFIDGNIESQQKCYRK